MTMEQLLAPLYHLELVRDRDFPYQKISTTEDAAQVLHAILDKSPVEQLVVVYLNSGTEIIGMEKVGMGGVESVGASPKEIFRGAIIKACPEILLCHNHVDGVVTPSPDDLHFTMEMIDVGAWLGIRVRDHIVVGPQNKHMSIKENLHKLSSEMMEANLHHFGLSKEAMGVIKDKMRDLLNPAGKKKNGDPNANANTDWMDSLSYRVLSME
jgi:hypothetical protein